MTKYSLSSLGMDKSPTLYSEDSMFIIYFSRVDLCSKYYKEWSDFYMYYKLFASYKIGILFNLSKLGASALWFK